MKKKKEKSVMCKWKMGKVKWKKRKTSRNRKSIKSMLYSYICTILCGSTALAAAAGADSVYNSRRNIK